MKISIMLFLVISVNSYSQTFAFEEKRHQLNIMLIQKNVINKIYIKKLDKDYEYEAKYLGEFKTKNGRFYLINSSYIHLESLHNDNQIFIYNSQKKFIGYYILATNYQLPMKLVNNILFFEDEDCINKIDLSKNIPIIICLKCKDGMDCIEFTKNK